MARLQQGPRYVTTDEPGAAGHKYLHRLKSSVFSQLARIARAPLSRRSIYGRDVLSEACIEGRHAGLAEPARTICDSSLIRCASPNTNTVRRSKTATTSPAASMQDKSLP